MHYDQLCINKNLFKEKQPGVWSKRSHPHPNSQK